MAALTPSNKKEHRMTLRNLAAALFIMAATAALADKQSCQSRDGHDDELLRKLYYYALLAESAKNGELLPWSCESNASSRRPPTLFGSDTDNTDWDRAAADVLSECGTPPCIQRLTTPELKDSIGRWAEIVETFGRQGWHVGVYEPSNGGPAYFVCDKRKLDVMVFIALAELQVPIDDGDLRPRIVRPIVWTVENLVIDEALQAVTLMRNNDLSNDVFQSK